MSPAPEWRLSQRARPKPTRLTHFLCIPLVNHESRSQLEAGLRELRRYNEGITPDTDPPSIACVPIGSIRPVGTIHLTLGVMSLDETQLASAIAHLESLDTATLLARASRGTSSPTRNEAIAAQGSLDRHEPLTISLRSLSTFHSPGAASVLYAEAHDPTDRLYPFALALRDDFVRLGFTAQDERPLKLHATLVNTIYVKRRDRAPEPAARRGSKRGGPLKFDAGPVMERFADHVWAADVTLDRVAVCEMGAGDVLDGHGRVVDQAYREVASRPIHT